jgi:LPS O-antigen subunit length determinant protein (WzzB/FepE family)
VKRPLIALAAVAAVAALALAALTAQSANANVHVNPPQPERTITGWG